MEETHCVLKALFPLEYCEEADQFSGEPSTYNAFILLPESLRFPFYVITRIYLDNTNY